MKLFTTQAVLVFSVIFSSISLEANPPGDHEIQVSVAPEDHSQALSAQDLRKLMDEAHEALETGEVHADHHDHHHEHCPNCGGHHHHHEEGHAHQHGFSLKALFSKETWKEKFNFKQTLLNALRWYQIKATNEDVKAHVANIVTMLLASHFSEGVIGSKIVSAGLSSEYFAVKTLGVVLGTSIVIPGLDPLCIMLVWTYKKMPHLMGKMMYVPRVIILKGAAFLYKSLGMRALMQNLFYKQNALENLERLLAQSGGDATLMRLPNEEVSFGVEFKGKEILSLRGRVEEGRVSWEQMLLSSDLKDPELLAYLKKEIAPLSWLLRQSIYDVIKRIESPRGISRLSYIESAHEHNGLVDVKIKTRGMASLPPTRFIGAKNCLFKLLMRIP